MANCFGLTALKPRERIISTARELFRKCGIRGIGVDAIAEAAGTNKMTLYRHFGSKDELIAELFVTRSLALNKERLRELREAEEAGNGRADISDVLRALVGPTLRGCLGPEN